MYIIQRSVTLNMIDRTQRVKDARSEAAKEVEAYKAQKEKDFKQFESEVSVFVSSLSLAFCPFRRALTNSILDRIRKLSRLHRRKLKRNLTKSGL